MALYNNIPQAVARIETSKHDNVMVDQSKNNEIHLSFNSEKLIDMQSNKKIHKKKLSTCERNFVNDDKLLHKVVRENDKFFNVLVVPLALISY